MAESISVLLVEDNPVHVRLVQTFLQRAETPRFSVEVANDLASALTRVRSARFDALLLDLILPDSQDMETFERVHAAVPDTPVVILTGLDEAGRAQRAAEAGAQRYLIKPIRANDLVAAVCQTVAASRSAHKHRLPS